MALNILKQVIKYNHRPMANKVLQRSYSLYEPDYLETGKSKIPLYPTLNIQITGYVYPLLEKYQGFIHKFTNVLDIDVDDSWAFPPKELVVSKFKQGTTVVESKYNLKIYERNIQISNVTATKCGILIRILEQTLPEGVSLKVDFYDPAIDEKRYIPDVQLLDLKSELSTIKKK